MTHHTSLWGGDNILCVLSFFSSLKRYVAISAEASDVPYAQPHIP